MKRARYIWFVLLKIFSRNWISALYSICNYKLEVKLTFNIHYSILKSYTVYRETFEEENFRKFRRFGTICESFLREFRGACECAPSTRHWPTKVFSTKPSISPVLRQFSSLKVSWYTISCIVMCMHIGLRNSNPYKKAGLDLW